MKRFSLRLEDNLHEMLRKESFETGISINDIIIKLIEEKYEGENKMSKEISILNKVDNKYRNLLEESEMEFYLEDGKYFVKMDMHYDKLGTWEDLIYFLNCQLEIQ